MYDNKHYVGKEVFIVGLDGDLESGDIEITESLSTLNIRLSMMNPIAESNLTVVHGILTMADYIPDKIGRSAYVIALHPLDIGTGAIFEVNNNSPEGLASLVETVVNDSDISEHMDIEDVFILYGYELRLGYSIREDEVDEQLVEDCQEVADEANKMKERITQAEV